MDLPSVPETILGTSRCFIQKHYYPTRKLSLMRELSKRQLRVTELPIAKC